MLDLERQTELRMQCIDTCQSVIEGDIGLVEGIRIVVSLSFDLGCEDEQPFLVFRGIESSSDHFPIGQPRASWHKDALAREDARRVEFERGLRDEIVANCKEIIRRFEVASSK